MTSPKRIFGDQTRLTRPAQELLKPLTSPAELDKHPTLSLPYKSKILDEMVQSTQEMVFREQDTLWRVKPLLSQFLGDAPYAPDGNFETDQDALLFRDFDGDLLRTQSGTVIGGSGALPLSVAHPGVASAARPEIGPEDVAGETGNGKNSGASADVMQDIENEFNGTQKRQINSSSGTHDPNSTNGLAASIPTSHQTNGLNDHGSEKANATKPEDVKNVSTRVLDERPDPDGSDPTAQPDYPNHEHMPPGQESTQQRQPHQSNGTDPDDADSTATSAEPQTHRMTTRARAQPPPRSTSPTPPPPQIHPLFIPPPTSLPQPPAHSTEIRRLLCSYTQKQEEVVRQGNALLDGLRKALRLRNTVWGWCRAEGHVGEMSDGEDWIDLEEWGVEGPLRKGEEVEDEDGGGILVGKGRRHRRAV